MPVLVVFAMLTFAGARFGWIPTAITFAALGFTIGWLAVSKQAPKARLVTAGWLAILAGVGGMVAASWAAPTEGRLRNEIERLAPTDWGLESDEVFGNAACADQCTTVVRTYLAFADPGTVRSDLAPGIDAFSCVERFDSFWECGVGRKTDITMTIEIEGSVGGRTTVTIVASAN
jgi:hypothetical protein